MALKMFPEMSHSLLGYYPHSTLPKTGTPDDDHVNEAGGVGFQACFSKRESGVIEIQLLRNDKSC